MHKELPKIFIFLDKYDSKIFKFKNPNIGIIYRNYNDRKRENQLIKIANACKKKRYKLFVSNDVKLAYKYKAAGIYVPSYNKTKCFSNFEKRKITIIGSAHNQKEIQKKITQNCKKLFISPVFPVKKSKSHLNIYKFNYLSLANKINIFALGGISEDNICKLKMLSIDGYGGISLFKKKAGLKEAGFLKNNFFNT
jgi:thiamine-phosphate pyrophosphorylase